MPIVLLVVVVVGWFWPITIAGRRPIGGEITSYYFPKLSYYDRSLGQGRLPLWNEQSDFGAPALGEGQIGQFYPLHLMLHSLFDTWSAIAASMVLHFVLAAWFAFLCARGFGASRPASTLTAVVFIGQGFFVSHLDQPWSYTAGSWLPLAVLAAWRWLDQGSERWLLGLSLVLSMQLLAGHFQIAFFTSVVVLIMGIVAAIFTSGRRRLVTARSLALPVAVFGALCLAAIQIVPTAEWVMQADARGRGLTYLSSFSTPPLHLVNYLAPTFLHQHPLWEPVAWTPWKTSAAECFQYVGLIPLALAVWALSLWRSDPRLRILGLMLLIGVVLSLGSYFPLFYWLVELPGFGWFTAAARWSIVVGLFLGLLAGHGLDRIDIETFRRWCPKFSLVAAIVLAMGVAFIVYVASARLRFSEPPSQYLGLHRTLAYYNHGFTRDDLEKMTPQNQLATMLAGELSLPLIHLGLLALVAWFANSIFRSRRRFVTALLVWTLFDLSVVFFLLQRVDYDEGRSVEDASPVLAAIAKHDSPRVVGVAGNLPMTIDAACLVGPGTPDMERYWDESYRSEAIDLWPGYLSTVPPLSRWGDWGTRLGRVAREGVTVDDLEFFRLSDIRLLVCGYLSNTPGESGPLALDQEIADKWLLTNLYGRGVTEMAGRSPTWTLWEPKPGVTTSRAWAFPVNDPPSPGTDPRVLLVPPPARRKMLDGARPARIESDTGEHVVVSGSIDLPAVLVLSDLHYPGWEAQLVQQESVTPVEIKAAFGRWRAVYVPRPGEFTVTFSYRPNSFVVGRRISIGAWLLWSISFAAAIWAIRNSPRHSPTLDRAADPTDSSR